MDKIEDSLEIYKNIFDNAKDIIILMSENGDIINANKEAVKEYGYSYEELLNMKVFKLRTPNNENYINEQFELAKLDSIEFETIHFRKDGSTFPVEVKSKGINVGASKCVVSTIRNITKRRDNDGEVRRLAGIVEFSQDAIFTKDLDGNITSWNKGAEKLYGYTKEEMLGEDIEIIIPEYLRYEKLDFLNKIANNENVKEYESIRLKKNGEEVNVSISMSPIYGADRLVLGASVISRDITENKFREKQLREKYEELNAVYEELAATEEELNENYKELQKANEAKSQFISNMSHEIRTPMNGVMGMEQLLELTELTVEQREYLGMIKNSSYELLDIINNILDISKIEGKRFSLKCTRFNFRTFLDNIIKELVTVGEYKGIEVMYFIDPYIGEELVGDADRVNQIIINLITNAIKFTEKGHIFFRVKKISSDIGKVKLQFSIEDTGIGIQEAYKDKLFKVFNQGDLSYTKKYRGTGLGLAISKSLAELMNGEIWYESEVGKGSTFYFTAEFSLDIKNINMNTGVDYKNKFINKDKYNKDKLILIAEDNEINMKIASGFLNLLGYKYLCAYNGIEAVEFVNKNKVDLILMDIQMPIMNGYEATIAIRECEKGSQTHIPIVAMTAYAMAGDREKFIDLGMDEYISKPFDIDTLDKVLKKF